MPKVASKGVIELDPGHGAKILQTDGHTRKTDPGAESPFTVHGNTVREADLNWIDVQELKPRLEKLGWKVVMTRDTPTADYIEQILTIKNSKIDVNATKGGEIRTREIPAGVSGFFSIHTDAGSPDSTGISIFGSSKARPVDRAFGRQLAHLLNTDYAADNRSIAVLSPYYHRDPNSPALVIEMGHIDNRKDVHAMLDPVRRGQRLDQVAAAINQALTNPIWHVKAETHRQGASYVSADAEKAPEGKTAVLTFTPGARNGQLALPDGEAFAAGAGNGAGRDNPELVFDKNTGSPPPGTYRVDAPKKHGFLMKNGTTDYRVAISLSPTVVGQMGERREIVNGQERIVPIRTQIDLHATHNSDLSSIGCVVFSKSDMDKIVAARKAGIFDRLRVVYDFGPVWQYAHRYRRHKVPTQLAMN